MFSNSTRFLQRTFGQSMIYAPLGALALLLPVACTVGESNPPTPGIVYERDADSSLEASSPIIDVDAGAGGLAFEDAGNVASFEPPDGGNSALSSTDAGNDAFLGHDAGITSEPCVALDNPSYFAQKVWGEVLSSECIGCHNAQGLAASSELVLQSATQLGFMEANYETTVNLALTEFAGTSKLVLKPLGELNHGGGAILTPDSEAHQILSTFVERIENGVVVCNDEDTLVVEEESSAVVLRPLQNNLRKVLLDLMGRLPTRHEYLRVQTDGEVGYREVLMAAMMEDSFYERLKEMFNDLLLTNKYNRGAEALALLNSNTYPARYWYDGISNNGLRNRLRDYANRAVAQEPLELIAHVVRENKPFTEVLTADYMMLNGFSANSYGLHETFNYPVGGDEYAEEYHKYRVYRMEGIPHAGILTTRAFLNRFPTTDTNRNRHRARMFFQYFLATDILGLGERPIDPTATETHNPTLNDPQCTVCHAALDPMAGTFQNWGENANYTPPETGWFLDMRAPGLSEDLLVPSLEHTSSLQWMAFEATQDPRFVWAMVYNTYWMLLGESPLKPEVDIQTEEALARFLAYEKQNRYFEEVGELFVASDYNYKQLLIALTLSEYYRAVNLDTDDEQVQQAQAHLGANQLLTPENLARKVIAVTGYPWRSSRSTRDYLINEFEMFYGGIDSDGTTQKFENRMASWRTLPVEWRWICNVLVPQGTLCWHRNIGDFFLTWNGISFPSLITATKFLKRLRRLKRISSSYFFKYWTKLLHWTMKS